jgi:hypothetical protein
MVWWCDVVALRRGGCPVVLMVCSCGVGVVAMVCGGVALVV